MIKNNNILIKQDLVANPTDAATATLSKLKYGDVVYSISGGGGSTYIGTNGITVDNTNYTIGIDSSSSTETEMKKLKVSDTMTLDKGATFTASSGAELNVNCDATFNSDTLFTSTVDLASATIQVPSIALSGTSGTLTYDQWTTLVDSKIPYLELDNNKYYYCGRTYDTTTTTLVRTLTYVCANVGKIVITCNDPVSPATEYTYSWTWTSNALYQHSLFITYKTTAGNQIAISINMFNNSSTAIETTTASDFKTIMDNYFDKNLIYTIIYNGIIRISSNSYPINSLDILGAGRTSNPSSYYLIYQETYGTNSYLRLPFAGDSTYEFVSCYDTVIQLR